MARLNIDALAREFGVSPIPVREALRRLEAQGWVQFKPNAGAIVSPVDATSWEQAMVALAILEGAATAEAQRHLRKSDFTRLRKIAADMESQHDPARFGKLNRRLHEAIVARCGNACLLDHPLGVPVVEDRIVPHRHQLQEIAVPFGVEDRKSVV